MNVQELVPKTTELMLRFFARCLHSHVAKFKRVNDKFLFAFLNYYLTYMKNAFSKDMLEMGRS